MVSAFRAASHGPCAGFCDCVLPSPKAIESFALMVKQTAQMLQTFGTELAETELPNDVQSTSLVLSVHTEKKAKAKVSKQFRGPRFGAGKCDPRQKLSGELPLGRTRQK